MGQRVELGVDLVLGDRALVTNQPLELCDLGLVLELQALDVLLGDLDVTLKL